MDRLENFRLLDPNRRQFVDIEEASIINRVGGDVPEARSKGLVLKQLFKPIEAAGVAFDAVNFLKRCVNSRSDNAAVFGQRQHPALDHFLLRLAFPLPALGPFRYVATNS